MALTLPAELVRKDSHRGAHIPGELVRKDSHRGAHTARGTGKDDLLKIAFVLDYAVNHLNRTGL